MAEFNSIMLGNAYGTMGDLVFTSGNVVPTVSQKKKGRAWSSDDGVNDSRRQFKNARLAYIHIRKFLKATRASHYGKGNYYTSYIHFFKKYQTGTSEATIDQSLRALAGKFTTISKNKNPRYKENIVRQSIMSCKFLVGIVTASIDRGALSYQQGLSVITAQINTLTGDCNVVYQPLTIEMYNNALLHVTIIDPNVNLVCIGVVSENFWNCSNIYFSNLKN